MPAAIPIAMAVGGAGLGAAAKSMNKPAVQGTRTPVEPDYFSNFRQSLIGPYGSMLARAGQPMYGAPEQANFLNTLNAASESNERNLASQLARRTGSVNSGAYVSGLQDIFRNRLGAQADFATKIPMLNKDAYFRNMGNVLGMGMNWAGRAPVGESTNQVTTQGSFLSNFLGGLAPMVSAGASGTGAFGNMGDLFGRVFNRSGWGTNGWQTE